MPAILATHLHAIFIKREVIVSSNTWNLIISSNCGILEVSILQTATRVAVTLVEIPVHFSRCLPRSMSLFSDT